MDRIVWVCFGCASQIRLIEEVRCPYGEAAAAGEEEHRFQTLAGAVAAEGATGAEVQGMTRNPTETRLARTCAEIEAVHFLG